MSGHVGPPLPGLAVRLVALAALLAAGTLMVHRLALTPVTRLTAAHRAGVQLDLFDLVTAGCGAALLGCWVWCLLAAVAVALDALRARSGRQPVAGRVRCPRLVHAVVLAVLGLGYGATPTFAETGGEVVGDHGPTSGVSGLPLPDRPLTSPSPTAAHTPATNPATNPATPATDPRAGTPTTGGRPARIRVIEGDSLWSVTAGLLPPSATAADIDRAWRVLARANARVVGADPDLIFPGTLLRVPELDHPFGKEHP